MLYHSTRFFLVLFCCTTFSLGTSASSQTVDGHTGNYPLNAHGHSQSSHNVMGVPQSHLSPEAKHALVQLAQQKHIQQHDLVVINDFLRASLLPEKQYRAVTIFNKLDGQYHKLLVDYKTQQVESKEHVESMERQAHTTKYGKLQPQLYEKLQQMGDADVQSVTIIIASEKNNRFDMLDKIAKMKLAAKYPGVRAAIARGNSPFDVESRSQSQAIRKEYISLLAEDISARIKPLATTLATHGYTGTTISGVPAVTTTLPKSFILSLAQRQDVGTIFMEESQKVTSALDGAVLANGAPSVWQQGVDGSQTSIAIVETGNVDFTSVSPNCPSGSNNCFRHTNGAVRPGTDGISSHTTGVASAAASDHVTYKGMAPGATIISSGASWPGNNTSIASALGWALDDASANIVNSSVVDSGSPADMTSFDWSYDYQARYYSRLLVNASGNNGNSVKSPSKAWNVLTVGAYDHRTNTMAVYPGQSSTFSNWINPTSPNGDHEKPEVVAPGQAITVTIDGGQLALGSGTSLAAPQVAGEAALLIDHNESLLSYPNALKAIIMATANKNIEGPTGIQYGVDTKDGAGAINALGAYDTAGERGSLAQPCSGPCWWAEEITNGSFDANNQRRYDFTAQAGDRIRVAAAWWASADCTNMTFSCSGSELLTDLDISVVAPDGSWLSSSASYDNNYELVPANGVIIAPQTGIYHIVVNKYRFEETSNYIGVAWTRTPAPSNAATISGLLYYDADENGIRGDPDDEFGISYGYINLYQDDGDGIYEPDTEDQFITTAFTDENGLYHFVGIEPNDYWVYANAGTTTQNPQGLLSVQSGQSVTNVDFGSYDSCPGCG